jgi:hypothetical protein
MLPMPWRTASQGPYANATPKSRFWHGDNRPMHSLNPRAEAVLYISTVKRSSRQLASSAPVGTFAFRKTSASAAVLTLAFSKVV